MAGDVRRGAVDRLEQGVFVAVIGARHDAQAADESGAQVADTPLYRFSIRSMSNFVGSWTSFVQPASMMISPYSIFGYSCWWTLRAQRRNSPSVSFMMLALCRTVIFLRPRRRSGEPSR
ncbi:MAG: hypothetical protein GX575_11705 [Candidatus Anammoximicrobium sp.]|nr:hypothetical protein [Candidatus Anammoximicrobium sp.]